MKSDPLAENDYRPFQTNENSLKANEQDDTNSIDLADLQRKSVRGGTVTIGSQGISTVVQLASTVILARMLTPADYGVIAMVSSITTFAGLFRDLGLSSASIQKRTLTAPQQDNLFWLNIAMGAFLTLIVSLCSPLVAWFYRTPELTAVTIALSLNFLIASVGAQHSASLMRALHFERIATAGIAASICSLVVAVAMAYYGFSYWALVGSSLCHSTISTIILWFLSPFSPGLPGRGRDTSSLLFFGAHVTAFDIINYVHRNLDNILIGRLLDVTSLGIYSRAYTLLLLPIHKVRAPLSSVIFTSLSKLQGSNSLFRQYFLSATRVNAYLTLPLIGFLAATSDEIIYITLGPNWTAVSPVFAWLTVPAMLESQLGLAGSVLLALGQVRKRLLIVVATATIQSVGFLFSVRSGIVVLASVYAAISALLFLPRCIAVFYNTPITAFQFLKCLYTPALISIFAAVCVRMLHQHFGNSPSTTLFQGFAAYICLILSLDAATKQFYLQSVKRVLKGKWFAQPA